MQTTGVCTYVVKSVNLILTYLFLNGESFNIILYMVHYIILFIEIVRIHKTFTAFLMNFEIKRILKRKTAVFLHRLCANEWLERFQRL